MTGKDGQNLQGKWSPYFTHLKVVVEGVYDKNKEGNSVPRMDVWAEPGLTDGGARREDETGHLMS